MFKKNNDQLICRLKPGVIAQNSDYVWLIFFGKLPSYGERLRSPFREDRNAGCRWSYFNGQWYFVDNKGYNNKVVWSIYDFVSWLHPLLTSDQVYNLVCAKLTSNVPNITKIERRPDVRTIQESNIIIKFEYDEWKENNYFTDTLDLPPEYLNSEPCYLVTNYWCNSKKDNVVRKNPFWNPKKIPTIAYHFISDNVKLYWPTINKSKLRWYTNTNANDFFGEHLLDTFKDYMVITKSGKDRMVLHYHFGLNAVGLQNEAICENKKLERILKERSLKPYVWFDDDPTGRENGERLAKNLTNGVQIISAVDRGKTEHEKTKITGKDPGELWEQGSRGRKIIKNTINEYIDSKTI